MSDLRQAAQQALEALEKLWEGGFENLSDATHERVMEQLSAALAEPEQEPVAHIGNEGQVMWFKKPASQSMLYTAPTPRKPLTEGEIEVAAKSVPAAVYELMYGHEITVEKFRAALAEFARAIERAHGIGEQQ